MDAKLKALKVVDLRHILATAGVTVPQKATKTDLIARIQASKEAKDAYAKLYTTDDLLAPPEEVDWNAELAAAEPPAAPKPAAPATVIAPPPAAAPAAPVQPPAAATTTTAAADAPVDAELEARRKRAERFGIPFVEPKATKPKAAKPPVKAVPEVTPDQLKTRAARFGLPTTANGAPSNSKKRAAPTTVEVDPEELERRKKRAERFGLAPKT